MSKELDRIANAKFHKCVQFVDRFDTQIEAQECLSGLEKLEGSFGEKDFLCQAFFECHDDVNPESISSCYGLRVVLAPIKMLINCKNLS
jgi:hypothetical protein